MWDCGACGEEHEDAFTSCWNCGGERKEDHGPGCACCGRGLVPEDTAWMFGAPDDYLRIAEPERGGLARITADQCIVADRLFYLCGNLDLPIRGQDGSLRITCWVRIDEDTHQFLCDTWQDPERVRQTPHASELANNLPSYPPTEGLPVQVVQNPPGNRPTLVVPRGDHPLCRDFNEGMSPEAASALRSHLEARS